MKKNYLRTGSGRRRTEIISPQAEGGRTRFLFDERTKAERPRLDICKIRTERFRDMTPEQLKQTSFFLGPVSMKERSSKTDPRGLVHNLLFNLRGIREVEPLTERSRKAYVATYGEEPMPDAKIRASYEREADRIERQIWDVQQKKGCPIATVDSPARDYVRGGGSDRDIIDAARGRRRRPRIR